MAGSHVQRDDYDPAPAPRLSLKIGETAPALRAPDLQGKMVDLADFRGSRILLLFWNPGCGFCRQLLPHLKAWELQPPKRAAGLLVVSGEAVEANREQGFRSTVVLDYDFSIGRAFGASGTPTAILIDGDGRVASDLAIGGPAVLALAGADQAHPEPAAWPRPGPSLGSHPPENVADRTARH
jgi:peroxiredoxin